MKQSIQICVRRPDRNRVGDFKELYRNIIKVDDSLDFDFKVIIKSMRMLYPFDDVMIDFCVMM